MQPSVISAVLYQSKKEAVNFYSSMNILEIKIKVLQAFEITEEYVNEFELLIPTIGCIVRSYEHIRDDSLLHLIRKQNEEIIMYEELKLHETPSKKKVITKKKQIKPTILVESKQSSQKLQTPSLKKENATSSSQRSMKLIQHPQKNDNIIEERILTKASPILESEEENPINKTKKYFWEESTNSQEACSQQALEVTPATQIPKIYEIKDIDYEKKDENEINTKINLDEIILKDFLNRKELENEIKKWASDQNFKLIFQTRERKLKDKSKVSLLICNNKKCPFYLEYQTQIKLNNRYVLRSYESTHNHQLQKKDGATELTPEILQRLNQFRAITKDAVKITKSINKEFEKSFHAEVIRYQLKKTKNEIYGYPTDDAKNLLKLMEEDAIRRSTFFQKKLRIQN